MGDMSSSTAATWSRCCELYRDFSRDGARPAAPILKIVLFAISRPIVEIDGIGCSSESWEPQKRRPLLGTLVPVEEPSTASIPDACIAAKRRYLSSSLVRTGQVYSGKPSFRRPAIISFAFDCPPRAIHADIANAGSISSIRAAASRASASRQR